MRRNQGYWWKRTLLMAGGPLVFSLAGCVDRTVTPSEDSLARFSMTAVFPAQSNEQAAFLDAWRIQLIRPGEGIVEEDGGTLGPTQSTVSVEFSLELNAVCEFLTIQVQLSSSGQVWFRADGAHEICSGTSNEIQIAQLEWVRPQPTVSPAALAFTVQERQLATKSFTISYGGNDPLTWTASVQGSGVEWLGIEPSGGTSPGGQPVTVQVRADARSLSPGQYSAEIEVVGEGFPDVLARIPVSLTVTEGPKLGVSTDALDINVMEGLNPDPRSFTVSNLGGGSLDWTAMDDAGWLALAPAGGTLGAGGSQPVVVSASTAQLQPGQHLATITVSGEDAGNSPQTINVSLTVIPSPRIGLSTNTLSFTTQQGMSPNPLQFVLSNTGGGSLNWSATVDAGWLSVEPRIGVLPAGLGQSVTATVTSDDFEPGNYTAKITITDAAADNSPQTILVSLTVTLSPRIGLSTAGLSYAADEGTSPDPQQFLLSNVGGGSLNWSAAVNAGWLQVEPANGVLGAGQNQPITATVDSEGLKEGNYAAQITIADAAADNSPQTVDVYLTITRRYPPTIWGFAWETLLINDPTCGNDGTRFEFYFNYDDPEGDVLLDGNSLAGTPIELVYKFRPDGNSGRTDFTGDVDGTGFMGSVSFEMCIAYQPVVNTSVDLTIRLMDAGGRQSNPLSLNVPRPEGGNSPNLTAEPQVGVGSSGGAGKGGSVLVRRRGGGLY